MAVDTTLSPARDRLSLLHQQGTQQHRPSATTRLPHPPSESERDSYLGPQHRWISVMSFAVYLLIVLSVGCFVLRQPWAAALLVPLAISGVGTCISLFTSSRRRRESLSSHGDRVAGWTPRACSVDVFLPSAGEDLEVLENTYRHVAELQWHDPVRVLVLDDSAREQVRDLAAQHGFDYLTRPDRGHFKKAGNLRYGFDHSDGDVIMVLDADFVPRPDALSQLVPYLDDERVGIVQSPQYFDATPQMNWLQRAAGATQILFYKWVQPSRDRSDAAICVGTSALYRRAALERSGGFALIGHSEDVHTGVKLTRSGYVVRYVPIVVTKGLCPDTMDQFMTQQYRWCTGSMSLLFDRDFHRIPLTRWQRLSYWSGFLYYITTAINVFVMVLPALLMGWFVPDRVTLANYVFVLLALVGRQAVVPVITGGRESLVGLARVQSLYSLCHAVALYDVLRGRTDAWVATGSKQRSRTAERVRTLARRWCLSVQVLLWGAIAWNVPVYGVEHFALMIAFAVMNLYITAPLITANAQQPVLDDLPALAREHLSPRGLRALLRAMAERDVPPVRAGRPTVIDLTGTDQSVRSAR